MESNLPRGYTSLYEASQSQNKLINVMGVVTDLLPANRTKGTDWQISFSIANEYRTEVHRVKFFAEEKDLPQILGTGDVVILRNIQHRDYRGSPIFLSNRATNWTVLHVSDIPNKVPEGDFVIKCISKPGFVGKVQAAEAKYAVELCNSRDRADFARVEASTTPNLPQSRNKFCLVESVQIDSFYDLVGEAVKVHTDDFGRVELYFTDYTKHHCLYNYGRPAEGGRDGDEFDYLSRKDRNWRGPPGQYTLAITLWQPHAGFCTQNIRAGDYVVLSNVHIKLSKDAAGRFEGKMHTDTKFEQKVNIRKVYPSDDEQYKDLLRRKKEFVRQVGDWNKTESGVQDSDSKKRKAEDDQPEQKNSKAIKRARKKDKLRTQRQAQDGKKNADPQAVHADECLISPSRKESRLARDRLNEHVGCNDPEIPIRPLRSIIDKDKTHNYRTPGGNDIILPFQNIRSRAHLRVVDYFPPNLKDFAVRERVSEFDVLDDDEENATNVTLLPDTDEERDDYPSDASSDGSAPSSTPPPASPSMSNMALKRGYKWTWRFALLVEDQKTVRGHEPERMILHVVSEDAEYLLKGLSACNLRKRKNERTLQHLTEKLFILWGDLQERKNEKSIGADAGAEHSGTRQVLGIADGNARVFNAGEVYETLPDRPSARPFACCIKEYGVRVTGEGNQPNWKRGFQIFGTVIKS